MFLSFFLSFLKLYCDAKNSQKTRGISIRLGAQAAGEENVCLFEARKGPVGLKVELEEVGWGTKIAKMS